MEPVRVLVVDDSNVMRRLVSAALETDPSITVVGTARDGGSALEQLDRVNPDLVTLDVEMPGMDGLATLIELKRRRPRLPVVMVSSHTNRGAITTLEALGRGASDYVTKPDTSVSDPKGTLARDLCPRVVALGRRNQEIVARSVPPTSTRIPSSSLALTPPAAGTPPTMLLIAASTGGPDAVTAVLRALPRPLGIPIVVVQHMPAYFTPMFAQRLGATCGLSVVEATEGALIEPSSVLVAPGDRHTTIERAPGKKLRVRLDRSPPVNFCRPSADVLFGAAATVLGGGALAVVLTGLGQDGKVGAGRIVAAGGAVLAQDEASSVVWGMPGAVVRAGFATRVVSLDGMAAAIAQRVTRVGAPC